jgi:uncharacterized membrane protein
LVDPLLARVEILGNLRWMLSHLLPPAWLECFGSGLFDRVNGTVNHHFVEIRKWRWEKKHVNTVVEFVLSVDLGSWITQQSHKEVHYVSVRDE